MERARYISIVFYFFGPWVPMKEISPKRYLSYYAFVVVSFFFDNDIYIRQRRACIWMDRWFSQ